MYFCPLLLHHPSHSALSTVHMPNGVFLLAWITFLCRNAELSEGSSKPKESAADAHGPDPGSGKHAVHLHFNSIYFSRPKARLFSLPGYYCVCLSRRVHMEPANMGCGNGEHFRLTKPPELPLTGWEKDVCRCRRRFFFLLLLFSSEITGRKAYSNASGVCPFK